MNENQSHDSSGIPRQLNASHMFILHSKNLPHLVGADADSEAMLNARRDFYSGFYAALGFIHLSSASRADTRADLLVAAIDTISSPFANETTSLDRAGVEKVLEDLVEESTANMEDASSKLDDLRAECLIELQRLAPK